MGTTLCLGDLIRHNRRAKDISQRAFKQEGIWSMQISRWENGLATPSDEQAKTVARLLDIPWDEMYRALQDERLNGTTKWQRQYEKNPGGKPTDFVERLCNIKVVENPEEEGEGSHPVHDYLWTGFENIPAGTFAVRAEGDSMAGPPGRLSITPGALVVFKPAEGIPQKKLLKKVVLVKLEDGEEVIRLLERQGSRWLLLAFNPAYPTITVAPESLDITGVAMFWIVRC